MRAITQLHNWWDRRFGKKSKEEVEAKKIVVGAQRLINAYGAVMEKYPVGYVDASVLPTDKDTLKVAMKIMWKLSNDNFRNILGGGFVGLYRFQDGVGPKPIRPLPENVSVEDLKGPNGIAAMKTAMVANEQFLSWSKRTQSEMESLFAEFRAFTKDQK
jgi:hypothetical protein